MPIQFAQHPQSTATVKTALDRFARGTKPRELAAVPFEKLTVEPPHAIYDLRADEIARGAGLESAHFTGVRHIVSVAGTPVAAAEVHTDAKSNAPLLANLNYGPFVPATTRAFHELSALGSVKQSQYEARLLRFSAIYVMAIWLKALDRGADVIYPLAPAPPELSPSKPYQAIDFLNAIRPLAQKRVAKTDPKKFP
jgi:hypothetical protein